MNDIITVPLSNETTTSAKIIYHKKGTNWAVTKLLGNYWDRLGTKPNKRYSSLTWVKEGHPKYGQTTSTLKNVYYKDIPVDKRRMSQKELIVLCKQFNKDNVTYESLAAMDKIDRKKLLGTL